MKIQYAAAVAALSVAIGVANTAHAEAPLKRPTEALYLCAAETDDAARLACFDTAVADLKSAENTGKVRTVDIASIEKVERDSFGFSLPSLSEVFRRDDDSGKTLTQAVEEVVLPIASISVNKVTKKASIRLENGQVWDQIDSTELSRSKVRKGKSATIKKAAMGSFMMVIDGSGGGIRVRRVN